MMESCAGRAILPRMFGCRLAIGAVSCALGLLFALGCGGSVEHGGAEPQSTAGSAGSPTSGGQHFGGSSAGRPAAGGSAGSGAGFGGSGGVGGGGDDLEPVDTECPMGKPLPPSVECDPFVANSCGAGAGCYPYVDHPEGSGCGEQQYGTACLPAGQGTQGALCGSEMGDNCAAGFVCVVGQRAGKRCAKL